MNRRSKRSLPIAAAPLILWTLLFVGATILYIVVLSLLRRNPEGSGAIMEFAPDNYARVFQGSYLRVFLKTLALGAETTLICLVLGYPFGLLMARVRGRWKTVLLLLVIVPFWTNALVRMYGWRILMTGSPLSGIFRALGLSMKTHGAVVLGMVYALIPFMILPVYSNAEKLDRTLIRAGRDLGASPARVFFTVELPLTAPGLISGCVLTFVPSLALFFISDLMGGTNDILIGNVIHDQLLKAHDWPFAAALSVILLAVTAIVMLIQRRSGGKDSTFTLF